MACPLEARREHRRPRGDCTKSTRPGTRLLELFTPSLTAHIVEGLLDFARSGALSSVLTNLLSNALTYVETSPLRRVRVLVRPDGATFSRQ